MVDTVKDSEYLVTRKTAEEYRKKGYEVGVEVPLDFMPGVKADLLVSKGDETKVIEVKRRASLGADPKTAELARLIESKPGWSFELLLVGEPEKIDSPEGSRSFESRGIADRVNAAKNALASGLSEGAFLLAWSALEATLRQAVSSRDDSDPQMTSPRFILDQAVFRGTVGRADYDFLTGLLRYRNAIAHGFTIDDFSEDLVEALLETTSRIASDASNSDNPNS